MTRRRHAVLTLLGVCTIVVMLVRPAHAHWADLAVAEAIVGEQSVTITLTFPTGLMPQADDDGDGRLTPREIQAHEDDLTAAFTERVRMTSNGRPGNLTIAAGEDKAPGDVTGRTHSTVQLRYSWAEPIESLVMHYDLFLPGISTASCLVTLFEGRTVRSVVFTPQQREFTFRVGHNAAWPQGVSFLGLGAKHIVTGYDHVLFLLTLLMVGGSLRQLLKVVTAFTVAHSVTLSLATLDILRLPAALVESGIALSIASVAAENLWWRERSLRRRWLVTFGFGLVHGLGFASVLRDLRLEGANLTVSLVGFNLGVEIGQIAIVAGAFLGLLGIRRAPWDSGLRRWVSAGAMAAGLGWFVQRVSLL